MWRQPRGIPANTFGPSWGLVLASTWAQIKSLANLALGLIYAGLVFAAGLVGVVTIVAGEALTLEPRTEALVQALVLFGVACYFLESWTRRNAPDPRAELERRMQQKFDAINQGLDARVQYQIRMAKERGR